MQAVAKKNIYRAIDANFNRLKEALRVCEDVCRFIFNDAALTRKLKNVRHELTKVISYFPSKELLSARDVGKDVGVGSIPTELRRKNVSDIFYANMQRAKESVRVL